MYLLLKELFLMDLLQDVRLFLGFMHHVLDITNRYESLQKTISELLKIMAVEDANSAAREHLSPIVLEKMCEMIAVMPVDLQANVEVKRVLFQKLTEKAESSDLRLMRLVNFFPLRGFSLVFGECRRNSLFLQKKIAKSVFCLFTL